MMLTTRQLLIFKCIVDEFIETAEPVGSKALMTNYQLPYSSATIRNEMSFLEEYGYLEKTHTSSGRIPSVEGYRFYVNNLAKRDLDESLKSQVAQIFSDRHRTLDEIIHESCQMLSELTHLTSVVLGPDSSEDTLQQINIVPLSDNRVTTIIITNQGYVENKVFDLNRHHNIDDLVSCVNVMNELLVGTPIDRVAFRLERDVKPVLSAKIKEHEELFNAFLEAFVRFASSNIYFSGKENMLYQPEYNDVNKLRRIVSAFENSQVWNALQPLSDEEGVTVRIGTDSPINDIDDVSVISASFKTGATTKGSISVIGPTRMPYEKVVSLVEYISKNIEQAFLDEAVDQENEKKETEEVAVEEQLKALEEEVNTWKTDYYKVFADMENLKRRLQNEHANTMKFMMQSFIEQLLPVVDNFERSLTVENPSEEIKNFLKGYEMIYNQLMQVLQSQGVEVIKTEGEEFDPNFHQAVMTVKDDNFKSNMIVEELQRGYKLKDRVIRASLVKVSE